MTLSESIVAAQIADEAFAAKIKVAGFKSHWEWDYRRPGSFIALRHAYRNKVEADSVMHAAFEASRKQSA